MELYRYSFMPLFSVYENNPIFTFTINICSSTYIPLSTQFRPLLCYLSYRPYLLTMVLLFFSCFKQNVWFRRNLPFRLITFIEVISWFNCTTVQKRQSLHFNHRAALRHRTYILYLEVQGSLFVQLHFVCIDVHVSLTKLSFVLECIVFVLT